MILKKPYKLDSRHLLYSVYVYLQKGISKAKWIFCIQLSVLGADLELKFFPKEFKYFEKALSSFISQCVSIYPNKKEHPLSVENCLQHFLNQSKEMASLARALEILFLIPNEGSSAKLLISSQLEKFSLAEGSEKTVQFAWDIFLKKPFVYFMPKKTLLHKVAGAFPVLGSERIFSVALRKENACLMPSYRKEFASLYRVNHINNLVQEMPLVSHGKESFAVIQPFFVSIYSLFYRLNALEDEPLKMQNTIELSIAISLMLLKTAKHLWEKNILHGDIKTDNILIDYAFKEKLIQNAFFIDYSHCESKQLYAVDCATPLFTHLFNKFNHKLLMDFLLASSQKPIDRKAFAQKTWIEVIFLHKATGMYRFPADIAFFKEYFNPLDLLLAGDNYEKNLSDLFKCQEVKKKIISFYFLQDIYGLAFSIAEIFLMALDSHFSLDQELKRFISHECSGDSSLLNKDLTIAIKCAVFGQNVILSRLTEYAFLIDHPQSGIKASNNFTENFLKKLSKILFQLQNILNQKDLLSIQKELKVFHDLLYVE